MVDCWFYHIDPHNVNPKKQNIFCTIWLKESYGTNNSVALGPPGAVTVATVATTAARSVAATIAPHGRARGSGAGGLGRHWGPENHPNLDCFLNGKSQWFWSSPINNGYKK